MIIRVPHPTVPVCRDGANIRSGVPSLVLAGLVNRRLSVGPLLDRHAPSTSLEDPYAEFDLRRYVALFEDAADLASDPFLGLRLGREIDIEQFGPLGIVILAADTLGNGVRAWARYSHTWQSGTVTEVASREDVWECTYRICDETIRPRRQDSEFTLALISRLFHEAVGRQWAPLGVQFEHAAPGGLETSMVRRLYQRIFRCPVTFGAGSNRILIDRSDLGRPTLGVYRALGPHVVHLLRMLEGPERLPQSVEDRVTWVIRRRLGHRPVTASAVASDLGLSTRTLQRRLEADGTSIRALVRACRRHRAEALLADPARPVTTVAHSLGYADTAALSRAFKTWTGFAPRIYRRRPASRS